MSSTTASTSEATVSTGDGGGGSPPPLTVKLRSAKRDCERGHKTPACNKLGAFDNEVKAQTDKGITTAQARHPSRPQRRHQVGARMLTSP